MIQGSDVEQKVKFFVTYIILAAVLFIEAPFWNNILCVAATLHTMHYCLLVNYL